MEQLNFATPPAPSAQPTEPSQQVQPSLPQTPHKKTRIAGIIFGAVFIILVLLLIGTYTVYGLGKTKYGEDFQNKIWSELITQDNLTQINQQATTSYIDSGNFNFVPSEIIKAYNIFPEASPEDLKNYDDKYSFSLTDPKFSYGDSVYVDLTDSTNPQVDLTFQGAYTNGNTDYQISTAYKSKDKDAFFQYDYNQAVADSQSVKEISAYANLDQFRKVWLKLADSTSLQQELGGITAGITQQNPADSLKQNRLFDIQELKGVSQINGHWTWDYKLAVNKQNLRNLFEQSLSDQSGMTQADKDYYMQYVDAAISQYKVKDFEIWLGVSDHKVYKFYFDSNALSITKGLDTIYKSFLNGEGKTLIQGSLGSAQSKSRDAERLADLRELATSLELFYNDNNGYPAAQGGVPVGLAPSYIGAVPNAPAADGQCNNFYNKLWYTPVGTPQTVTGFNGKKVQVYPSYQYTTCLGGVTGGLAAGVIESTPQGVLNDVIDTAKLPTTSTSSSQSPADQEQKIKGYMLSLFKTLPFDAEIKISEEVKDYGKPQDIQLPTDYKDSSAIFLK